MPAPDPHDLARFVAAQQGVYAQALAELRAGRKRTQWMWFVFPQFAGLGHSPMAQRYAIRSLDEARAYLAHPVLGPRLVECCEALLAPANAGRSAREILGSPDDLKLRSCATLFAQAAPAAGAAAGAGADATPAAEPVFHRLLDRFYNGRLDPATLRLLAALSPRGGTRGPGR